jgi:hypothetical protein
MIVVKEIRTPTADCATIILPVGKQLPGDRPRPLRVGTVARLLGSAPVIIAYWPVPACHRQRLVIGEHAAFLIGLDGFGGRDVDGSFVTRQVDKAGGSFGSECRVPSSRRGAG